MMSRFSPFCLLLALVLATSVAHAQSQSAALFRSLGLLGSSAPLTKVIAVKPGATQKRVAAGTKNTGPQNLTGPLKFNFTNYSSAQRGVLQNFVNANYARMVEVYGAPAPEQAGKTVTVEFEARASSYIPPLPNGATGGTIVFGYNDSGQRRRQHLQLHPAGADRVSGAARAGLRFSRRQLRRAVALRYGRCRRASGRVMWRAARAPTSIRRRSAPTPSASTIISTGPNWATLTFTRAASAPTNWRFRFSARRWRSRRF